MSQSGCGNIENIIMNTFTFIRKCLLASLLFGLSFSVFAEESPYKTYETNSLRIKLSSDGTGIVQGIQCYGCDYSIVKITRNSRFTDKGQEVGIVEAQERSGKPAMVSFTPSTREVQYIRW